MEAMTPFFIRVLTTSAPAATAAAAQATDIFSSSLSSTPRRTRSSAGVLSRRALRKASHSKGVITPAVSQRVISSAPASTAAVRTSLRKAPSARVASKAERATCSV